MTRIAAMALNTFREAVRNKVLYLLLFFALGLIGSGPKLSQLSIHENARVLRDVGLGGMTLFGLMIAVFIGINLVYKEIDRKTVFALIPKPIHRWEFIVGKFLGMALTLAVLMAVMTALFFALLIGSDSDFGALERAVLLLFGQVMLVTALAVLFSSFSTPILSGAFTLGIAVIGFFTPELRELIARTGGAAQRILGAALHIVPDMHLFYVSGAMVEGHHLSVHGTYVDWSYVAVAFAYAIAYSSCAIALSAFIFSRRDFV
jgi:ABC-type transport system involved in multi-copper enzyme maturation permease subunit